MSSVPGAQLRDEYVIEASYYFRLTQALQCLLDAQYLIDPANNPSDDRIWVLGVRVGLSL